MASEHPHHLTQYPAGQTDLGWGPGSGPWNYRKVSEPTLSSLLAAVARPNTIGSVDIIDFQPQTRQASEDRHVVQDWDLQNGTWKLLAVFDGNELQLRISRYNHGADRLLHSTGHAGSETVKHIAANLPGRLQSALIELLVESEWRIEPASISNLLSKAIISYDNSLTEDLYGIFPGGLEKLRELSDDDVKTVINDGATGGPNHAKVARCMQGSTVLVSLIGPDRGNVWVASLGDCQAGMFSFLLHWGAH